MPGLTLTDPCPTIISPMNRTRIDRNGRLSPGVEALEARAMLSGGAIGGLSGLPGVHFSAVDPPHRPRRPSRCLRGGCRPPHGDRFGPGFLPAIPPRTGAEPPLRQHPLRFRTIPTAAPLDAPLATSQIAQAVIDLTNQDRATAGAPPLGTSPALTMAAQLHSQDMARLDQMSHDSPVSRSPR